MPFYTFINERLGIADVVYRVAKDIYEKYKINRYEERDRSNVKDVIAIDTSTLEEPFSKMLHLNIIFAPTKRPKNVHGGMDRINEKSFNIYIYQHCNNVPRTLTHELDHVYQVFLKGKHYKTDKDIRSSLRKSEESPTLMSIYTQLIQRGVDSKKDFLDKLKRLPKYKKYVTILEDPKETVKHKKIAREMIKKMYKMYPLFIEEKK